MEALTQLPVSVPLLLLATAFVVAGAPLFAAGLHAFRLRRALAELRETAPDEDASGVVMVRGEVVLESPMFAPLSGKPCAGYALEISGEGMRVGGVVRELRPFRLAGEHATARVVPDQAQWHGGITGERTVAAGEAMPERLAGLLGQSPEVRWLQDRRVTLCLTERALEAGSEVFVTGVARASDEHAGQRSRHGAQVFAMVESVELAATGTDSMAWSVGGDGRVIRTAQPELWIEADEPLRRLLVSAEAPRPAALAPPFWKLVLMLLGPALALAGLLYLTCVAAPFVMGRF